MRAIGQRLGFYLVTAVVAISLDFLIPRLIPGNPVDAILAKAQGQTFSKATLSDGPQTVPGQAEQTARFYGGVPGRGYARMVAEPQRIQCPLLCLNDPTDQEELRRQAAAAVEAAPDPASRHHVFAPLTKLKGRLAARTGDVLGPAAGAT